MCILLVCLPRLVSSISFSVYVSVSSLLDAIRREKKTLLFAFIWHRYYTLTWHMEQGDRCVWIMTSRCLSMDIYFILHCLWIMNHSPFSPHRQFGIRNHGLYVSIRSSIPVTRRKGDDWNSADIKSASSTLLKIVGGFVKFVLSSLFFFVVSVVFTWATC